MISAEELNRLSADDETLTTPQPALAAYVGETALTSARRQRTPFDSSADHARQGMQESMDLREQGHSDD
ncbi:MAG: hypothetical protein ABIR37_04845 [Candidatus Saccharimonadales bacterium]